MVVEENQQQMSYSFVPWHHISYILVWKVRKSSRTTRAAAMDALTWYRKYVIALTPKSTYTVTFFALTSMIRWWLIHSFINSQSSWFSIIWYLRTKRSQNGEWMNEELSSWIEWIINHRRMNIESNESISNHLLFLFFIRFLSATNREQLLRIRGKNKQCPLNASYSSTCSFLFSLSFHFWGFLGYRYRR